MCKCGTDLLYSFDYILLLFPTSSVAAALLTEIVFVVCVTTSHHLPCWKLRGSDTGKLIKNSMGYLCEKWQKMLQHN